MIVAAMIVASMVAGNTGEKHHDNRKTVFSNNKLKRFVYPERTIFWCRAWTWSCTGVELYRRGVAPELVPGSHIQPHSGAAALSSNDSIPSSKRHSPRERGEYPLRLAFSGKPEAAMHTLMYLVDDLDKYERIQRSARNNNLSEDCCYVLSKDKDTLNRRHLPGIPITRERDIFHSCTIGALLGIVAGALFMAWLAIAQPLGVRLSWWALLLAGALIVMHAIWAAGMTGLRKENYKLQPFLEAIEEGHHLVIVQVDNDKHSERIKAELRRHHPDIRLAADDPTGMSPFRNTPEFRVRARH
jgi:hypothetical protein